MTTKAKIRYIIFDIIDWLDVIIAMKCSGVIWIIVKCVKFIKKLFQKIFA